MTTRRGRDETDLALLRRAIALAARAAARGDEPFGAVLAEPDGTVVREAANTQATGRDPTGHAEANLVREAIRELGPDALAGRTVYASGEPCPMCAAAMYWAGVARVVYALGGERLAALRGDRPRLALGCRELLARGSRPVEVDGPLLDDEAEAPFRGRAGPAGAPD